MKKFMIGTNILLSAAIFICGMFYAQTGDLFVKSISSIGFTLLAAANLVYTKTTEKDIGYATLIFYGLLFCMFGDIAIVTNFIAGAALFAVGHVFYILSYGKLIKFTIADAIPGLILFAASASVILVLPIFEFGSAVTLGVCITYAFIISMMLGKAFSNFRTEGNGLNSLILVGCVLFYFSDLMLLVNRFLNASEIFGMLCIITYYPAQCILAYSAAYSSNTAEPATA